MTSATYERYPQQHFIQNATSFREPMQIDAGAENYNYIWGFEGSSNEAYPVPLWQSDQSLGGPNFPQYGFEAFMMPPEMDYQYNNAHDGL